MKYPNKVVPGVFIKRINRFIAQVKTADGIETVHVRNTGRCREIFIPGARVFLEEGKGEKRKTRYSLIAVYKEDRLINVDSQIVNYVFEEACLTKKINFLTEIDVFSREKAYNSSRFDFYYETKEKKGFIEVKGVTLESSNQTMFPDAPTLRGQKHLKELMDGIEEGYENYIVFIIQMENTESFRAHWETDPKFAELLKEAAEKGVHVLAYDTLVSEDSITLNKNIEIRWGK